MRSFASDNNSGICPEVLQAIIDANADHAPGYGDDPYTRQASKLIKAQFGDGCVPLMVFNGTGSNCVALQLCTRSYDLIFCTETAHILVDECGAPVRMTGCQLRTVVTPDGKLTPRLLEPHVHGVGDQHHSQPRAIYISQCTELGTVYSPEELKALTDWAHGRGMVVHMDGARLANACAAMGKTLREMTADCGVDILSLGGTKNGMMLGECVVIFNHALSEGAAYVRKQSAQLASKMRFISAQFVAYLTGDLWLQNASHANEMARRLQLQLAQLPGVTFTQPMESNQLFFTLPTGVARRLRQDYYFYFWDEDRDEVRLVTSWDTTQDDIDALVRDLRKLLR